MEKSPHLAIQFSDELDKELFHLFTIADIYIKQADLSNLPEELVPVHTELQKVVQTIRDRQSNFTKVTHYGKSLYERLKLIFKGEKR